MEDIDMSQSAMELFPEANTDVSDHVVGDQMSGVKEDVADLSDKGYNFQALREEVAKAKSESEYWRGQAEAYSKRPEQKEEVKDPYASLDWDDPQDVRKAFEGIRQENYALRNEINDTVKALQTKSTHTDWNDLVKSEVPELAGKNKLFAEMIEAVSNPYEAAYLLADLNRRAKGSQQQEQVSDRGQRAIQNAQRPGSLSSVGGSSKLSKADYYAKMSDEEFMKAAAENLALI